MTCLGATYYPDVADPNYHVVPDFGRKHELAETCWCHPESAEDLPCVVVHNVEN